PIHLLGYSAGAYMAQELARQLEARGRTVGFLGLIDTGPATVAPPTWGERLLMTPGFLRNLAYWSVENNYRVSLRNAMRRVRHFGRRVNPRRRDAPVLGRYRRLEKQFLQMLRGHHTGRTAAPITLIRARCQSPWLYRTTDLGWHHYASTVNVRICPGVDHYNIIAVDHMPQLGRMIFESLETAVSPISPLS
ncbi:MAG: thioesterase domain-containing protein, partial [Planctomycetaceae bacterium]